MLELSIMPTVGVLAIFALKIANGKLQALPVLLVTILTLTSWLAWKELFISPFAQAWSRLGAIIHGNYNLTYFLCILALYLLTYSLAVLSPRKGKANNSYKIADLKNFFQRIPQKYFYFVAMTVIGWLAIKFFLIDWELVWSNSRYLSMADAKNHGVSNPIGRFIFVAHKFLGIIVVTCFAVLVVRGEKIPLLTLFFILSLWFCLFQLAGHSRYAVVYFGIMSLVLLMSHKRRHKLFALLLGLLALVSLAHSLIGRSIGHHGFSSLPSFFETLLLMLSFDAAKLVGNALEGVFVQGEAFIFLSSSHPDIFKVLSFSPFPSFIDGFAQNALQYKIGFRDFVPMGATGEVLLFGPGYIAFYYLVVGTAHYMAVRFLHTNPSLASIVCVLIFSLATILQFTYPVRTSFRFFYLVIIISAFHFCNWKVIWSPKQRIALRQKL